MTLLNSNAKVTLRDRTVVDYSTAQQRALRDNTDKSCEVLRKSPKHNVRTTTDYLSAETVQT